MDLPTTSSRLPCSNHLPLASFRFLRISMPAGSSPRTVTFMPSGASTLARLITVTISKEAMGSPFKVRAIPALNFKSWNCDRVKFETSSVSDPLRITRICSGSPLEASVLRRQCP
jgi:hypothetical protein